MLLQTLMYMLLCGHTFFSVVKIPKSGIAGNMVTLCSTFEKLLNYFWSVGGFQFIHVINIAIIFYYMHPSETV